MLDFTPHITLSKTEERKYITLRVVMYAFAISLGSVVLFRILFPPLDFHFSFLDPANVKNTLTYKDDASRISNGKVPGNTPVALYASTSRDYSQLEITYQPNENENASLQGKITVRKSFQAFLSPEGNPAQFRDGSLIAFENDYFIVSKGQLRKFASQEAMETLGYQPASFLPISAPEFNVHSLGAPIGGSDSYPDGALFVDQNRDIYYQLANSTLTSFVSSSAYHSRYRDEDALPLSDDLANKFGRSEEMIGFADGTIVSYAGAAFTIEDKYALPIDGVPTFESMQFSFDTVLPVGGEEIAIYKKPRAFTIRNPHPSGTVFFDSASKSYYLTDHNLKRKIAGQAILSSYAKQHIVTADSRTAEISVDCTLEKRGYWSPAYGCSVPLEAFKSLPGNAYETTVRFADSAQLTAANAVLTRTVTWENMKLTLSTLKNNIITNILGR